MKKQFLVTFLFTVLMISFGVKISSGQEYYVKDKYRLIRSHYADSLVAGVNIKQLVSKHLPAFRIENEIGGSYSGRTYSLVRNNDNMRILLKVGIYPDIAEAEEQMLDYLNRVPAIFLEGDSVRIEVGDNSWFVPERDIYDTVAFVRKNVKITLITTSSFPELVELAKSIDADLMQGASYVSFENTLSPPVVQAVSVSKNQIKEEETSLLTVFAFDPKGINLYYGNDGGAYHTSADPAHVFRVTATRDRFGNNLFGIHEFPFWVMNEDNFFSRKLVAQVTF